MSTSTKKAAPKKVKKLNVEKLEITGGQATLCWGLDGIALPTDSAIASCSGDAAGVATTSTKPTVKK